jgi:hypothetical protein
MTAEPAQPTQMSRSSRESGELGAAFALEPHHVTTLASQVNSEFPKGPLPYTDLGMVRNSCHKLLKHANELAKAGKLVSRDVICRAVSADAERVRTSNSWEDEALLGFTRKVLPRMLLTCKWWSVVNATDIHIVIAGINEQRTHAGALTTLRSGWTEDVAGTRCPSGCGAT